MKIVLFIGCLSGGGAERVVANLANHLADRGHDVTVLTISTEQTYYISDSVKWVKLCSEKERKMPHILLNVLRMTRLACFFLTRKPDVYLTFLPKLSKTILSFRRVISAPIILAERNDPATFFYRNASNQKAMEKFYPRADAFVFQTDGAKAFYEEHIITATDKTTVIPNAINEAFIGKCYDGIRTKRIVSAGRLNEQKNYPLLIDAFAEFNKVIPGYQLVIYGEGPQRKELEKRIADLSLERHILLPGRTDQIIESIRDASLFILPSDFEGMPNALAEAMALGLPCIATDCPAGGSRFLIQNGVNGILVPVGNVEALTNAMFEVVGNAQVAQTLGIKARQVAHRLSAEEIYKQWEKFIEEVVNAHKEGK